MYIFLFDGYLFPRCESTYIIMSQDIITPPNKYFVI